VSRTLAGSGTGAASGKAVSNVPVPDAVKELKKPLSAMRRCPSPSLELTELKESEKPCSMALLKSIKSERKRTRDGLLPPASEAFRDASVALSLPEKRPSENVTIKKFRFPLTGVSRTI
jgi:hypothetical protein